MLKQQIPQLTELGERLANDPKREALQDLLAQLPNENVGKKKPLANNPALTEKHPKASVELAVKSAKHILNVVWSMQNIEKINENPTQK